MSQRVSPQPRQPWHTLAVFLLHRYLTANYCTEVSLGPWALHNALTPIVQSSAKASSAHDRLARPGYCAVADK